MTRKRYEKKLRAFGAALRKHTGQHLKDALFDAKNIKWGVVIDCGKYKGQPLVSYAMAWDMILDAVNPLNLGL